MRKHASMTCTEKKSRFKTVEELRNEERSTTLQANQLPPDQFLYCAPFHFDGGNMPLTKIRSSLNEKQDREQTRQENVDSQQSREATCKVILLATEAFVGS